MATPEMTNEELDEEFERRLGDRVGYGRFVMSNHIYWEMAREAGRFWCHGDEGYVEGYRRIRGRDPE